jgi:hypothetical protein
MAIVMNHAGLNGHVKYIQTKVNDDWGTWISSDYIYTGNRTIKNIIIKPPIELRTFNDIILKRLILL